LLDALSALLAAEWTIARITVSIGHFWRLACPVACVSRFAAHADRVERRRVAEFPLPRGVPNAVSVIVKARDCSDPDFIGVGILGIGLSNLADRRRARCWYRF
jgi:hypothetical protein